MDRQDTPRHELMMLSGHEMPGPNPHEVIEGEFQHQVTVGNDLEDNKERMSTQFHGGVVI